MLGLSGMFALLLTILCCEKARVIGRVLGVMDRPDGTRKLHGQATPMVGGLALALPLVILQASWLAGHPNQERLFVALIIATGGLLAARVHRRSARAAPIDRLIATFLLFGLILMVEPKMSLTALDFGGSLPRLELGIFAVPFTLVCLVGILNAINMADGRNGLVLGIAVCWAYGLGEYAHLNFQPFMHFLLISLVTVLIYNWSGRLFLGDSGSYVVGALLGLVTIYLYNEPRSEFPMAAAALWLMVPVLDCLRLDRASAQPRPLAVQRRSAPPPSLSLRPPAMAGRIAALSDDLGRPWLSRADVASTALGLLLVVPLLYVALLAWLRRPAMLASGRSRCAAYCRRRGCSGARGAQPPTARRQRHAVSGLASAAAGAGGPRRRLRGPRRSLS